MRPLLLPLLLLVAACDSSDPTPATTDAVFVGNQGIFTDNGGSVTRYDPATGTATPDAVADLGGLVQSLTVHNDRLYVLLNFDDSFNTGRGRIDVVDLQTGQRVQQIAVPAPRSMAVTGGTAYVTNLYSASVTPVYLATGQTGSPIAVADNPEGVVVVGQRVYVANSGFGFFEFLTVIDAVNNVPIGNVDVCTGPRALLVDDEGEVWVFCTGRSDFTTGQVEVNGEVVVLDGGSGEVVARFPVDGMLGTSALGQDAAFSASRDEAFVAKGAGYLRFDTAENALVGTIAVPGAALSAVAVDDATGRLYLGRLDPDSPFAADGFVSIHDPATGVEMGRFAAGVIPGAIAFRTRGGEARVAGR